MLDRPPPNRSRRALRWTVVGFAVTVVIAVGAFAGAAAVTHDDGSGSPEHVVRDFLVDAVVDRDGVDACAYATTRSLRRLEAADPRGATCVTDVAEFAHLTLGGEPITTEAAVKALSYSAERLPGGDERVTVSGHGDSRVFLLRPANQAERVAFRAPSTPWRIDEGLVPVLKRPGIVIGLMRTCAEGSPAGRSSRAPCSRCSSVRSSRCSSAR
jgi:hypothetical protein